MEARPLAELSVPRLERLGGARVGDDRPRPVSGSAPSSRSRRAPSCSPDPSGVMSPSPRRTRISRLPMMSVQPSSTRSSDSGMPDTRLLKFSIRRSCQPGSRLAAHSGSVGRLSRTSIDDGVRWKTNNSFAPAPTCGTHWTAVAPVPMMPTRLSARPIEAAVGTAPGVVVVPAAGVERVPLERGDALDARQLRTVQRPARHHDVARPHRVAAVGADDPALIGVVPAHLGDLGLEAGVAIQVEVRDRSPGCARGSRRPGSTSPSACSRSPRAAAGTRTTRRRMPLPDSGSSTRCRRSRRPSRPSGCRRCRPHAAGRPRAGRRSRRR